MLTDASLARSAVCAPAATVQLSMFEFINVSMIFIASSALSLCDPTFPLIVTVGTPIADSRQPRVGDSPGAAPSLELIRQDDPPRQFKAYDSVHPNSMLQGKAAGTSSSIDNLNRILLA